MRFQTGENVNQEFKWPYCEVLWNKFKGVKEKESKKEIVKHFLERWEEDRKMCHDRTKEHFKDTCSSCLQRSGKMQTRKWTSPKEKQNGVGGLISET